jgi:predicted RNA binding protein with dsRBD fold (UPF0201 family)
LASNEFALKVTLEAHVGASEDPEKVLRALENVLGDAPHTVERGRSVIRLVSEDQRSLKVVHDQLRDRHVRAAARRLLLFSVRRKSATVMLNRQAAFGGVVVVCSNEAESSLGPIHLTVESGQLESVIAWLTAYEAGG